MQGPQSRRAALRSGCAALLALAVWALAAEGRAAAPFEIIAIPDIQNYNDAGSANNWIWPNQTSWIVANKAAENIVFVTGEGDNTNGASDTQWANAIAGWNQLNGVVPYSISLGNHDTYTTSPQTHGVGVANSLYFMGDATHQGGSAYGGAAPDGQSFYQLLSASGFDLLHLNLKYAPTDSGTVNWAQGILTANAGRPTIVTTHDYLNVDGTRSATGNSVWSSLINNNSQIFMVLAGHNHDENRRMDANAAGRQVPQILADYQDYPNGGDGYLRKVRFDPDNSRIEVRTYSTTLGQFQTDDNSQFDYNVTFNQAGNSIIVNSLVTPPVPTASYTGGAWQENFSSLGVSGTAAPTGWSIMEKSGGVGTYNAGSPIDAAAAAAATATSSQALQVWNATSGNTAFSHVGGNVGAAAADTDRALGLSPTGVDYMAIQLVLKNNSGAAIGKGTFSYDLRAWPSGTEELPGLRFFYSLTGGTAAGDWIAVPALDTTAAGSVSTTITFPSNVPAGGNIWFRWADDNGSPSPEWVNAVDNVAFQAIPLRNLTWDIANATGAWNTTAGNQPWKLDDATPAAYQEGDPVNFTQAGSAAITVDAAGVAPSTIAVSHPSGTYTFSGGQVSGNLTKSGAGSAVFHTPVNFSTATVSGGALTLAGTTSTLGALSVTGGTLALTAGTTTLTSGGSVAGGGRLDVSAAVNVAGPNALASAGTTNFLAGAAGTINRLDLSAGTTDFAGGAAGSVPTVNMTGGAATFNAGAVTNVSALNLSGGTATINNVRNAGGTQGVGAVAVSGTGQLNLGGTIGTLAVSGGTVTATVPGAQAATADFSAPGGGTVNGTAANPLAITSTLKLPGGISAALSGGSSFTASSGGNLADNAVARTLTLSGGTLTWSAAAATTAGLVGYWKLDDAVGSPTAADASAGWYAPWDAYGHTTPATAVLNPGTVAGSAPGANAVFSPAGKFGGAIQLTNSGAASSAPQGYVKLTGTAQAPNTGNNAANLGAKQFTLAAWIKQTGAGITTTSGSGGITAVPILSKGKSEGDGSNIDCNYFLGIDAAGHLAADYEQYGGGQNYPATASTTLSLNTWYHVAATYDGIAWKLFVDGAQVGSATVPADPRYDSIQNAAIGSALNSTGASSGGFNGYIDDARIYNRALSLSEIAGLAAGPGLGTTNLPGTNIAVAAGSASAMDFSAAAYDHTLGNLSLAASGGGTSLTLAGANSLTAAGGITVTGLGTAGIAGSVPLLVPASQSVNVAAAATLTIAAPVGGASAVNKTGGGALTLAAANTYSGGTNVTAGTLTVALADALPGGRDLAITGAGSLVNITGAEATAVQLRALDIDGGSPAPAARLDLQSGKIVIDKTQTSVATIRSQIRSAYAAATWTGGGIASAVAAADRAAHGTSAKTAVGYLDNALPPAAGGGKTSWAGRNVDSNSVLVRYTYYGDANLDGAVNLADFGILKASYGTGSHWYQADFDYSGTVNLADFGKLKASYGAPPIAAGAAVPEPAAVALLATAALVLLAPRARRRLMWLRQSP